jgi:aminoglycoside 6-adenylyltransferase
METIEGLKHWAEGQSAVRAMLLTSTRAIPNGMTDQLSDYDIILALIDVLPFHADRSWLGSFGPVLAVYHDPMVSYLGFPKSAYVTQYENGLKIDFTLWQVEILQKIVAEQQLPEELDAGYLVLLDKDRQTEGLKPPTYHAYIPKPPTRVTYLEAVEVFFLEAAYVAKFLWRDDLMAAKYILDYSMKQDHLRPMLEWHMEIEHQWSVKPGPYGRGMKKWLRADLWKDLGETYTGINLEANWTALFRSIDLFRKAAIEVGDHLGYRYPHDLDRRAGAYLQRVKGLDHGA